MVPVGGSSLSNIDGTYQILNEVNSIRRSMGKEPLFHVQLVGIVESSTQKNGLFTIKPEVLINDIKKTDIIFIPAMFGGHNNALENNRSFIPWLLDQYKHGAEVASYCIGAFFLAATGLLDGKQCATHWSSANEFRAMYPAVNLVDDKIMTAEDRIYTSGGAYSYLNLLLYVVEKYAGRDMAILISKAFAIDINRESQSPFIIFQGQRAHEDDAIKDAQDFIEKNYQEKITVDEIARQLALGRRSLERRFKKATSNTVTEYIQRVKMEAAKKGFESSRKNINEVMYEVGYADTKAFRTVFKKVTGLSPIEYRNKYNRSAMAS